MTLTIELGQDIGDAHLHTKNCVHTLDGLVVRVLKDRQTDTHTDGTDSITLTASLTREVTINLHHMKIFSLAIVNSPFLLKYN